MSTTPNLGLTQLEIGQAEKEATINANNLIVDGLFAVAGGAFPAVWARAYHNATQSLTTATVTAISLNSERYDTNVIHDTSTNNSRLTCKTAGVYLIIAHLAYAFNATGVRQTSIRLNGTTFLAHTAANAATSGSFPTRQNVSSVYMLAVNDYVEMTGYQESGGALNTEVTANASPEFSMVRLGA